MKKPSKILILHGWEGAPNLYWFPLAKEYFTEKGYEVFIPQMPGGYFPKKEAWLKIVEDFQPDENWILIGHSLGGVTILKYLEKSVKPISRALLIATPYESMKFTPIANFFEESFDWQKIKQNCPKFEALYETDDPVVPLEHGRILAEKLGVRLHEVPGGLHFHTIDLDYLFKIIN